MKIEDVVWNKLRCNPDERGCLTAIEGDQDIPFEIKRVFYMHDVIKGSDRGGHAHLDTDQFAVAVHGSLKILVSDGRESRLILLDHPGYGVYLPRMTWTRLMDFSDGAVCLVLANSHYDRPKSIRTWPEYLLERGLPECAEFKTGIILPSPAAPKSPTRSYFVHDELLTSALCTNGFVSEIGILEWHKSRSAAFNYSVRKIPLDKLKGWDFDKASGDLRHSSGKFFSIEGLDVRTSWGTLNHWSQPIINQPEVGILGFLAKRLNGVIHLLVQAKMEPGNINLVQISPTVQATRSNYTQVHGGRRPTFVEFFLGEQDVKVLYDQLQSEQGTNYLQKRNRNVIVQIPDDLTVNHTDDFLWLTIGQIQRLMRHTDLVHLDCRSILGGLSYNPAAGVIDTHSLSESFGGRVLESIITDDNRAENSLAEVLSILTQHKCNYEVQALSVPLKSLKDWGLRDGVIQHETGSFFSVIGVDVQAGSREVTSWNQPLVHSMDGAILALVAQIRNEILHFLIQIRVEPGFIDIAELAPTVQCVPNNYIQGIGLQLPPFVELIISASHERIRFDSIMSEEGGRFYHSQQRHIVIELEPDISLELPPNYLWMTMRQIQDCARFSNLLNIELRSILSCVSPTYGLD